VEGRVGEMKRDEKAGERERKRRRKGGEEEKGVRPLPKQKSCLRH